MLGGTLLTLAGLGGLVWAEARDHATARAIAKTVASTGFVIAGWSSGAMDTPWGPALLLGLVAAWLGDVLLLSSRTGPFLAGIVAFALAHLAYTFSFLSRGISPVSAMLTAAVLVGPAILVIGWLRPHVRGPLWHGVRGYVVIITVMVAAAVGAWSAGAPARLLLGALAFYLSDLSVARDRFVVPGFSNRVWGLPLYYGAQLAIATAP